jgi:hypothetical protein
MLEMNKVWWNKCGTQLRWGIQTWIWGDWVNLIQKYLKIIFLIWFYFLVIFVLGPAILWKTNRMIMRGMAQLLHQGKVRPLILNWQCLCRCRKCQSHWNQ